MLTMFTDFMFGLFMGGVDVVAARHFLFFMVASILALSLDLGRWLCFGSFAISWRGRLRLGSCRGLQSLRCNSLGGRLFFIVSTDLLSEVVVELLEALIPGRDGLEVDF